MPKHDKANWTQYVALSSILNFQFSPLTAWKGLPRHTLRYSSQRLHSSCLSFRRRQEEKSQGFDESISEKRSLVAMLPSRWHSAKSLQLAAWGLKFVANSLKPIACKGLPRHTLRYSSQRLLSSCLSFRRRQEEKSQGFDESISEKRSLVATLPSRWHCAKSLQPEACSQ